jgi:hypothetical protein
MEGKWETPFHLFPFSPQIFLLQPSFFLFILRILLYHGFRPLFTLFFLNPWPINYNHAFWCNKSFTHSLSIWFWLNIFFPFIEIMALCMATSYEDSNYIMNEKLAAKSFLDLMLTQHLHERCTFFLKSIPFELGIISFLWTFASWWFCCKSTPLLVMKLKLSLKVVTRLKTDLSSHGL